MNDKKYLAKILKLCTPDQTKLFNRMYPNGVPDNEHGIQHAISQVENTIGALNCKNEQFKNLKVELFQANTKVIEHEETINELHRVVESLQSHLSQDQLSEWRENLEYYRRNS